MERRRRASKVFGRRDLMSMEIKHRYLPERRLS